VNEGMEELKMPKREDGMPDLNNTHGFMGLNGYKTLRDLLQIKNNYLDSGWESIFIKNAISAQKNEIAESFAKALCEEGLSTQEAISILEIANKKIMNAKFSL
jgi:hypothetical protein